MMTLYDYLPSQNAYKVRLLLSHLEVPFRTEIVSIFEVAGRTDAYLAINPMGVVPALKLDDGRIIAESNAILTYLSHGTHYLPEAPYAAAKVHQWLSFERSYVSPSLATLRYWCLTGKLDRQPSIVIEEKRALGSKVLGVLDRELNNYRFLVGDTYTIADMSVFAYTHLADEAGFLLNSYEALCGWIERVRGQEGFLPTVHPYSIDPHSRRDLP